MRTLATLALAAALVAAVAAIYRPDRSGGAFHLDDGPNLGALAHVDRPGGTWLALLRPDFRPPGRPLAMATFIAQAESWPERPIDFKRVNIALHACNALLVFAIALRLLALHGLGPERARIVAFAGAFVWATASIHISSVLYVVQRMNLLSGTLTLLGVWGYLHGRALVDRGAVRSGAALGIGAAVGGTGLGFLCKENAILLPLYPVVLEGTLLRAHPSPLARVWARSSYWLPPALVAGLAALAWHASDGYAIRDFDLVERLLTQCRILFDYAAAALWPAGDRLGIWRDAYPVSRSLVEPASTLPAVLGVIALASTGVALRRRRPMLAFGLLWFFAGHLLESSVLPLQLYFEHRNYLPGVGPFLALAAAADAAFSQLRARSGAVTAAAGLAAAAWVAIVCTTSYREVALWADPPALLVQKAADFPSSERARGEAAKWLTLLGDAEGAMRVLLDGRDASAPPPAVVGQLLYLRCRHPGIALPEVSAALRGIRAAARDDGLVRLLSEVAHLERDAICPHLGPRRVHALLDGVLADARYDRYRPTLLEARASLHAAARDWDAAIESLDRAVDTDAEPDLGLLLQRAYYALRAGRTDVARASLDRAQQRFADGGWRNRGYRSVIRELRERSL